jgi:hypothetical protein
VSPGVDAMCEPAMGCVDVNAIVDDIPKSTRRARYDTYAQGSSSTEDAMDNASLQDDVMWGTINVFLDSER